MEQVRQDSMCFFKNGVGTYTRILNVSQKWSRFSWISSVTYKIEYEYKSQDFECFFENEENRYTKISSVSSTNGLGNQDFKCFFKYWVEFTEIQVFFSQK